uniref:Uncharacterized protein n=1 Tax=Daucus carota subsp. sativus TaxID=79200 RepID=A0A161WS79_DAUCS
MDSNTHMNLLQLTNDNTSMEERIKMLQAENSILEHKIKLMEIQQTHDEAVVTVLKNHIEERRAFNRLLMDDSNFKPSEMERREKLREEIINEREAKKRAKVSPNVDEQEKNPFFTCWVPASVCLPASSPSFLPPSARLALDSLLTPLARSSPQTPSQRLLSLISCQMEAMPRRRGRPHVSVTQVIAEARRQAACCTGELAGIAVGATVMLNILRASQLTLPMCLYKGATGASMNPVRTLGPSIATNNYKAIWIYSTAPILDALAGAAETLASLWCHRPRVVITEAVAEARL